MADGGGTMAAWARRVGGAGGRRSWGGAGAVAAWSSCGIASPRSRMTSSSRSTIRPACPFSGSIAMARRANVSDARSSPRSSATRESPTSAIAFAGSCASVCA